MQKEIGSSFDIKKDTIFRKEAFRFSDLDDFLFSLGIVCSDSAYLSTGRGAENFILDTIQKRSVNLDKVALIPPFTCGTVVEPFLHKGYKLSTYPVKSDLSINIKEFENTLISSGAKVVLFHRYFGFDTLGPLEELITRHSEKGVYFIEDKTHSIYSNCSILPVDYIVGSLRKWGPLPDGGFAVCSEGHFHNKPQVSDIDLEKIKLEAFNLKYEYLHENKGDKQIFLDKLKMAEDVLDVESRYYRISKSGEAVQLCLNLDVQKKKRRDNYTRIYDRLQSFRSIQMITPQLGIKDVPLYFPVKTRDRVKLQTSLRDHNIYAPILWPKPKGLPEICKEAKEMYDTVLCLPIDQRYDLDDMDRLLAVMKEYEKSC